MNSRIIKRKQSILTALSTILLFVSFLISNYSVLTGILVFMSLLLVVKTRNNVLCFCSSIIIAYANYSLAFYRYWHDDLLPYNEITTATGTIDVIGLRACIVLVFVLILILNYKIPAIHQKAKRLDNNLAQDKHHSNVLLVVITCLVLVFLWTNYYEFSFGDRAGYSPQYEYSTIFFILGFKYAGKNKLLLIPLLALALFYITFDFLGGQRSTGVQIAIIVALMVFYDYLSVRRILIFGLGGMLLTSIVATIRASLFQPDFTLHDIIADMFETGFASDTAGYAYYTSLTYIGTMSYYDIVTRLSQFSDFIASIFVTGTVGEALPYIALHHYHHDFGGVLGIYMFYYLGYLGTVLIGCLVAFYYGLMNKVKLFSFEKNGIAYIIAVYVSATTIRWYLYSPSQLLRGVMLLSIVYFAYHIIEELPKVRRK